MGGIYKEQYGLSDNVVNCMRHLWSKKKLKESDFESFYHFLEWCSRSDYVKFAQIRRYNEDKPHGPENSFWYVRPVREPAKKQTDTSPFCENCENNSSGCNIKGCLSWREWFIKNWNDNICIKPKCAPEEEKKNLYFQYEHPDLVREGIVWRGN